MSVHLTPHHWPNAQLAPDAWGIHLPEDDPQGSYFTLWELSCGAEAQDVLAVAVELSLFTKLADGPRTIPQIAAALGIALRPAEVLAVTCASIGVLRKVGAAYANVPQMEDFLVEGRRLFNQYAAFGRAGVVAPPPPSIRCGIT